MSKSESSELFTLIGIGLIEKEKLKEARSKSQIKLVKSILKMYKYM